MSLVGPRPEQAHYVEQFRRIVPRYMERHHEKGGMTGWAQVNGLRGDTSIEERTRYDLWYSENWSIWLDIKIIIRTLWQIVNRENDHKRETAVRPSEVLEQVEIEGAAVVAEGTDDGENGDDAGASEDVALPEQERETDELERLGSRL